MKTIDKSLKFVRWGNIGNSPKHKECRIQSNMTHAAPVLKGFYAFPEGFVSEFILGVYNLDAVAFGKDRVKLLKDENNNLIRPEDYYDRNNFSEKINDYLPKPKWKKLLKKRKIKEREVCSVVYKFEEVMVYRCNKHVLDYKGILWCHLGDVLKPEDILEEKNGWYKVSYNTYVRALKKSITIRKFHNRLLFEDRHGDSDNSPLSQLEYDWFEVFIPHIR